MMRVVPLRLDTGALESTRWQKAGGAVRPVLDRVPSDVRLLKPGLQVRLNQQV